MNNLADVFVLQNGVGIPCVGFGTFEIPAGQTCVHAVEAALGDGYRHVDTAAVYKNEADVGKALEITGIPRDQTFLTSKLWNTERGYDRTLAAFDRTLEAIGSDFLDLYLVHWPSPIRDDNPDWAKINCDTWRAMEKLYKDGRVRAIGVSNFMPRHLEALDAEVAPMVNQIKFHPGLLQAETVDYCKKHNILVEAWSPLGRGDLLHNDTLCDIAAEYGKNSAQLIIRWCLQKNILPLVRSINDIHIMENAQVFDFNISPEDMARIDAVPHLDSYDVNPDLVDF